jgi:hypothetical protein
MSWLPTVYGQGMVYDPDWSDEQGDLFNVDINNDYTDTFERPNELKRFPSNEDFDKDKALLQSFGLHNYKQNKIDEFNIFPESSQLGIILDGSFENELERSGSDSDEIMPDAWPNTDNMWYQDFSEKRILSVDKVDASIRSPLELVKIKQNLGDREHQISGTNQQDDTLSDDIDDIDQNSWSKESRWGKDKDKDLFWTYRTLWRSQLLNLNDVLSLPLKKNKIHKRLIEDVANKAKWKGKISMLVRRLKKILHNGDLSVREKQDLTRMYKRQIKLGQLDWDKLLYEFPGKNLIYVRELWKDIKVKVHPDLPAMKSQNFEFSIDLPKKHLKRKREFEEEKQEVGEQSTYLNDVPYG